MKCDIVISISIIRYFDKGGDTMTENQKLDLIIVNMQGMQEEIKDIKDGMQGMQEEIKDIKDGMQGMQEEIKDIKDGMQGMQEEIKGFKKDARSLRRQVVKSTIELKDMDEMILDEVERVHGILERHKADKTVHTV